MARLFKLANPVKHYEWGSPRYIPELIGTPSPDGSPWAELWMGCHPASPSHSGGVSLGQIIAEDPIRCLGEKTARKYGTLPFLFKLLAAASPLSIQAHPNEAQAREGFERENRLGLPLDAPNRSYKDPNHKPELLCALTPFTGMCGFRAPDEINDLISNYFTRRHGGTENNAQYVKDSLSSVSLCLCERSLGNRLRNFLNALFNLSDEARKAITEFILSHEPPSSPPCLRASVPPCEEKGTNSPEWGLMRLFAELYPGDPAVIAPLYLNVFHLEPGEAIFLEAGVLHSYISGFAVELMANSDNVLRGGLTGKHVDIPELLNITGFYPQKPRIIRPAATDSFTYPAPCEEFSLTVMRGKSGEANTFPVAAAQDSPAICIVTDGEAIFADSGGGETVLKQGESAFIPPAALGEPPLSVRGHFTLYSASCPL